LCCQLPTSTRSPVRHRLSDFDYPLPPELIAQVPARERAASRLLHVEKDRLTDLAFREFPGLIQQDDVVVINDTRVIHARLRGTRPTGGRVEILIERIVADDEAWVQMKASHLPKVGGRIDFPAEARYQTIYARVPGAVAAPTAGLHVDEATLADLAARGVTVASLTLHVGAGTFQPLQTEDIGRHRMHAERYAIPEATVEAIRSARARGGRVLAIGTTSLRALESAADERGGVRPGRNETDLYITPGYRFRVVDRLLTNFHLPRSTLLVLASAFAGFATIRRAYAHAIERRYRFFSYGDCMLLERSSGADDSA